MTTNAELLKLCDRVIDGDCAHPIDRITGSMIARALRDRIEGEDGATSRIVRSIVQGVADDDATRQPSAEAALRDNMKAAESIMDAILNEDLAPGGWMDRTMHHDHGAAPQDPLRKDPAHQGSTEPQQNASNGVGIRSLPSVEAPPEPERVTIQFEKNGCTLEANLTTLLYRSMVDGRYVGLITVAGQMAADQAHVILQRFGNRLGDEVTTKVHAGSK